MAIDVTITDNSDLFRDALPEQVEQALIAIGEEAESYAKDTLTKLKAVDTGRLRASVTFKTETAQGTPEAEAKEGDADARGNPEKYSVYIGTNVEYASIIENGTSKREKRPFLRPAAANNTDRYKKLIEAALKD